MDRLTQSVLVALVGGALVGLTASGRFALYVKTGFGPLLLAAGIVLLLVGIAGVALAVSADRRTRRVVPTASSGGHGEGADGGALDGDAAHVPDVAAPDDDHGHDHDHDRSRPAWLLVIPVLALLLAPPALGADAVARTSGSQALPGAVPSAADIVTGDGGYAPNDGSGSAPDNGSMLGTIAFPPLPAGAAPAVPLKDLVQRALYDATGSVSRHPVTVTGFIAPAGEDFTDGYSIAQLVISCCAADARAVRVHVEGTAPFAENTWVTAVLTAYPGSATLDNEYVPTVAVASIQRSAQPDDPYGR